MCISTEKDMGTRKKKNKKKKKKRRAWMVRDDVRTASSIAISQKGFIDIFTLFSSTPPLLAATRTCRVKKRISFGEEVRDMVRELAAGDADAELAERSATNGGGRLMFSPKTTYLGGVVDYALDTY